MIKRMLVLAVVVFAVAVPVALADDGAPPTAGDPTAARPVAGGQPAAGARGHGSPAPQLQQRLQQLRRHVVAASIAFHRHCVVHVEDVARCTDAAKKGLARLQQVDANVGKLIDRIHERCDGGDTSQAEPRACARADQIVQVLQGVQTRIGQLEQKLQDWLANPRAGGSSNGSSSSADGLEPLDQLGAHLAAARAAAQQSGIK